MTGPDLAAAIADRLRNHQWYDNPAFPNLHEPSAHGTHEGVGFTTDCAVCMKRVDRIAAVAAQVAAEVVDEWTRTVDRLADHLTDLTGQRDALRRELKQCQARFIAAAPAADTAHRQLRAIREARTHTCERHCTEGGCDFDLSGFVDRVDDILNEGTPHPQPGLGSPSPRAQDEPAREEVRWAYRWRDADGNVHDEVDTRDNARETAEQRAHRLAANRPPYIPGGAVVRYRVVTTAEVVATYPAEREG